LKEIVPSKNIDIEHLNWIHCEKCKEWIPLVDYFNYCPYCGKNLHPEKDNPSNRQCWGIK